MASEKTATQLSTQELLLMLQEAEAVDPLLDDLSEQMNAPAFQDQQYMEDRDLSVSKLGKITLLSRSFMYQLCSGDRAPGRDIALRLALGLELTAGETRQFLHLAQRGTLYPRVQRDAILTFCLNREKGICETDEMPTGHGERSLL